MATFERSSVAGAATAITVGTTTVTGGTTGSVLFVGAASVVQQDNANFFWDDTNNRLGLLTAAPTHSLTLGSTSTGMAVYNTADQTTNFDRGRISYVSNVFEVLAEKGGSATLRSVKIGNTGTYWQIGASVGQFLLAGSTSSVTTITHATADVTIAIRGDVRTAALAVINLSPFTGLTASSGSQITVSITGTVNQTGTASWTGLLINPTLTAVGSGGGNLLDIQASSVTQLRVNTTGSIFILEKAAAGTSVAAYGQVWIKNATPNTIFFTDDAGTDFQLATLTGTETFTNKTLTSPTLTTPSAFTTGGSITLAENSSIALDPAGSADGKFTGITVTATSGYTQAFGDLVYLDPTDSRWEAVDANSAAGADGDGRGNIGMVVVTGTDGNACTILLQGIIRADAKFPTFTVNNPIYASETAAAVTHTKPTTTDAVVRTVGFALTTDEMYFNPSQDYYTAV